MYLRKLSGFSANTIGYYVRGLFTKFLCPNSKVLTLPQLSLIIVGAPITIIQFLKVGYGDNYNTKMRPLAVNVTEIHCQTIFLLTIGVLAPLTAAPLQSSTHNHFEKITPLLKTTLLFIFRLQDPHV